MIREMAGIPLASILGGPLKACIQGMQQSCQNSIKFIKDVGFAPSGSGGLGDAVMVTFKIQKPGGTLGSLNNYATVTVPFLTLVHIPFLRLDKVVIDFSVKFLSSRTTNVAASQSRTNMTVKSGEKSGSTNTGDFQRVTDTSSGSAGGVPDWSPLGGESSEWNETVSFTAITSTREDSVTGAEIRKEFSLNVIITCTQDALPVGMEKMLDIIEAEIKDTSGDAMSSQLTGKMLSSMQSPLGGAAPAAAAAPTV